MRGTRTNSLNTIVGSVGSGVGGKCIALGGPVTVTDYVAVRGITHQFDRAVSIEGLRAVFAVPVRVNGVICAAVYGASRAPITFGERLLHSAMVAVSEVERALESNLQAERREDDAVAVAGAMLAAEPGSVRASTNTLDDAQEIYAELRAIASWMSDRDLRRRLLLACDRLCHPIGRTAEEPPVGLALAPREIDVLIQVAVGCTNAEAAERLPLQVETVKSYLKSAMCKLDSHNRVHAVRTARRLGLLP
jgi:DNA-binding CsgD family transcriptional regulator